MTGENSDAIEYEIGGKPFNLSISVQYQGPEIVDP